MLIHLKLERIHTRFRVDKMELPMTGDGDFIAFSELSRKHKSSEIQQSVPISASSVSLFDWTNRVFTSSLYIKI